MRAPIWPASRALQYPPSIRMVRVMCSGMVHPNLVIDALTKGADGVLMCVDEKPSIQALERAQGYLKLPNGRALTGQSHDYKRHGTTTLFAALDVATGKIVAAHSKRRRRVEFLGFMNSVVAAFPDRELHVILDNLNTHKKNEHWLKKHPKVHFHFTPTRSSWLNQIETWFSICRANPSAAPPSRPSSNCRSTSMRSSQPTTRPPSHSPGPRKRSTSGDLKLPYHSNLIPGTSTAAQ